MGRHLINIFTAAVFTAAQLSFASPVLAQSDEAIEAARRVNIAGRQRMLSQRMSKAACFISISESVEMHNTVLGDAYSLFDSSLVALRTGSDTAGLSPEGNHQIIEALGVVAEDWAVLSALVSDGVLSGQVSRPAMVRIDETGLDLLANMNRVVNKTANIYGNILPDMPLILSLTIDLAGRQRMFTQKAAKEFCLIDSGIDVETNRANLAKTANLFSLTLGALINGMPGMVMAAPNDNIHNQLVAVQTAWEGPKAVLELAASGAPITDEQRAVIVNDMDRVLNLMNEAVGMYEQAIPAP